jgi:hypothetical protein
VLRYAQALRRPDGGYRPGIVARVDDVDERLIGVRRSISVLGSSDISAPPYIGVAVNLIPGAPQTGDAVAVNVALPVQELIDRDVVEPARFFDRHPAAAHSFDDSRLSLHRPPLLRGWQRWHPVENFGAIIVR